MTGAALTMTEAARRAAVSRSTVRRRLDRGAFPGAWRDDGREGPGTGPWRVPVEELIASGLDLTAADRPADPEPDPDPEPVDELAELRAALAVERERRAAAEALAAERAERIDDLRGHLRQLEAGSPRRRGFLARFLEGD